MSDKDFHLYQTKGTFLKATVTYFKVLPLLQCFLLYVKPLIQGVLVILEGPEMT